MRCTIQIRLQYQAGLATEAGFWLPEHAPLTAFKCSKALIKSTVNAIMRFAQVFSRDRKLKNKSFAFIKL